ncbi:hypothetical protein R1flu_002522 [Riccia fluitans]|uniref:Translation initiation factor eIF2B subunit epsilon n=1 Tax=Riccia fluitans TaxID=41844 RepID=A0ABD1Y6C3_9MARC
MCTRRQDERFYPAGPEEPEGQAVLLADSFAQQFRPITDERPKVLLPLVNVPMIDYTLEWLASAGVEEVFVFCCAHAKQVTSYLEREWTSQSNFTVTPIESRDCVSAGDALRVIDQRGVVRGDFILISGDTVSNMSLKEVLKEHQERRRKDKLAVMTMVYRRCKPHPLIHQSRLGNEELLLVTDPSTKQLLHYDSLKEAGGRESTKQQTLARQVVLERSLLSHRPAVQLCSDVQDCHIDICSPEVLLLFTDNFDYQHLRRDFVKGLLSDEILGNKIHTYEIVGDYAARIDNLRAYDVVSKDIIHRWTYPMVPDIRFASPETGIKIGRSNIYKEDGVVLAPSTIIGPSTVVGSGTSISDKSIVKNSVIGRGCTIGSNVVIEGSHIWNNVTIGDNVQIRHAVVCDGVNLKAGAILEPGVVLSFKVVIGENFTVPAYSKISLVLQRHEEDSSDEELEYAEAASGVAGSPPSPLYDRMSGSQADDGDEAPESPRWDPLEVGVGGAGCKWSTGQDDEWRHSVAPIPAERVREIVAREEEAELEDAARDMITSSRNDNVAEQLDDDEEADEEDDSLFFDKEVEAFFRRAVTGESSVENVVLEVNSLKLADDRSFSDCAGAMFRALLNLAAQEPQTTSGELLQNTRQIVVQWGSLLRRFLKHQDDEMEVLLVFEEICTEDNKEYAPIFASVLQELYDKDVISEEAIIAWASEKQHADESDKIFVKQCEKFIQWLQEASEEEEEDEDEAAYPEYGSVASATRCVAKSMDALISSDRTDLSLPVQIAQMRDILQLCSHLSTYEE